MENKLKCLEERDCMSSADSVYDMLKEKTKEETKGDILKWTRSDIEKKLLTNVQLVL